VIVVNSIHCVSARELPGSRRCPSQARTKPVFV
jgi:hypothetical protein